jgi:transposase
MTQKKEKPVLAGDIHQIARSGRESTGMDRERKKRQEAREQLVTALLEGHCWKEVSQRPDVPLKRAMAYRLLHAVRTEGSIALQDGRHGHPSKLRGEARAFLEEQCRQAPATPSSTLQEELRERFDLSVSISQINRVRAALGISNRPQNQEQGKKQK